jgi:1-phosphofructokinase family hexose kinase
VTLNPGLDRTLTVEKLHENTVLRALASQLNWGGKGFNVARGLHALGIEVTALGVVGGFTGQMLAQGLGDLGITTDFVTIPGETRTNTVFAEADSGRYFKVNEPGPTVHADDLAALVARVEQRVTPGSLWALCGSLPPGAPPDTYALLTRRIHSRGGVVYLDTSGAALRTGLGAAPDLVKPNAEEAAELTGMPVATLDQAQAAAHYFLDQGAHQVALSLGAQGLLLATPRTAVHARPPEVTVQTPVGVGDALLAGLLDARRQGLPMLESARWGVACGTAAAMTAGVDMGNHAQVTEIAAQVRVTTI